MNVAHVCAACLLLTPAQTLTTCLLVYLYQTYPIINDLSLNLKFAFVCYVCIMSTYSLLAVVYTDSTSSYYSDDQ